MSSVSQKPDGFSLTYTVPSAPTPVKEPEAVVPEVRLHAPCVGSSDGTIGRALGRRARERRGARSSRCAGCQAPGQRRVSRPLDRAQRDVPDPPAPAPGTSTIDLSACPKKPATGAAPSLQARRARRDCRGGRRCARSDRRRCAGGPLRAQAASQRRGGRQVAQDQGR